MAAISSNTVTISYDGTPIGDITSISAPSVSVATIDTTSMDDIFRTFLGGTIDSGELSVEFMYDPNSTGQTKLEAEWESTASVNPVAKQIVISFLDTGSSTYTFDAILTGMSVSAAIDSVVTGSASFKVSGSILIAGA